MVKYDKLGKDQTCRTSLTKADSDATCKDLDTTYSLMYSLNRRMG